MVDLKKLSLLIGVAKLGSISAAASEAGCTASSASEQLAKLERELGIPLLERGARSVMLTAAGKTLAQSASKIIAEVETAQRNAREVAGLAAGTVRVASYQTAASRFVIPGITRFRKIYPNVLVTFDELEPEDAVKSVLEGSVDLAITNRYLGLQEPDLRDLEVQVLGTDRFLLVAPEGFLTQQTPARLIDFAGERWIASRPSRGFQAITELAAARSGFTPNIVARADNYDLIIDLVAANLGLALVPERVLSVKRKVSCLELDETFNLARQEAVVYRNSDYSQATRMLRKCIIECFAEISS